MKQTTSTTQAARTAGAPQSGPRAILDVEDGLHRIMGDRALYFKLLRRFQHDHQSAARQIGEAFGAGRYDAARVKAHTLKGAAGMIGAYTLYDLAAAAEAALRAQAPTIEQPLRRLELALNKLLSIIGNILPDFADAAAPPLAAAPADAAAPATQHLLARLANFLREGDGAAIDVLEKSATVLAARLGVDVYQEIAAAAHEFDFDGALAVLLPHL